MGHVVSAVGPGLGAASTTNQGARQRVSRRVDSADQPQDTKELLSDQPTIIQPAPKAAVFEVEYAEENDREGAGDGDGEDVVMELEDIDDEERSGDRQEEEVKAREQRAEVDLGVRVKGLTKQQLLTLQALSLLATEHAKKPDLQIPADLCVIVLDTETTGLYAKEGKGPWMTELAAVSLAHPSSYITSLVRLPEDVKIEQKASELSGITDEMCRQGKSEIEALLDLVIFAQEQKKKEGKDKTGVKILLVAHNAPFDAKMISGAFQRTAFQPSLDLGQVFWVDTLKIVRNSGAREKKNSLGALVEREFPAIDTKSMHRALADCFALSALIHRKSGTFSALFEEKNWKPFYETDE